MKKINTHLTQNGVLLGTDSPTNVVTPHFIGQLYIQNNNDVHIAHGLNSSDWTKLQSGYSLSLSVPTYEDMLRLPQREGTTCYVEESKTYYRLVDNNWVADRNYVLQAEEPTDKNVIWFTPEGTVAKPSNSDITIEELVATISVLVTKIRGLEKRIAYLEENGISKPPIGGGGGEGGDNTQETNILLLENGEPLLLENGSTIQLEQNIQ